MQRNLVVGLVVPVVFTITALFFLPLFAVLFVLLSGGSAGAYLLWYAHAEKRNRQAAIGAAFEHGIAFGRLNP